MSRMENFVCLSTTPGKIPRASRPTGFLCLRQLESSIPPCCPVRGQVNNRAQLDIFVATWFQLALRPSIPLPPPHALPPSSPKINTHVHPQIISLSTQAFRITLCITLPPGRNGKHFSNPVLFVRSIFKLLSYIFLCRTSRQTVFKTDVLHNIQSHLTYSRGNLVFCFRVGQTKFQVSG